MDGGPHHPVGPEEAAGSMICEPVVPAAVPEAVAATTDDPAPTTPASVDLPADENIPVDDAANDNAQRRRMSRRSRAICLRLVSAKAQSQDVARALDLGEETVSSHLKKAQTKLGARNRTHAVVEALRQHLIP